MDRPSPTPSRTSARVCMRRNGSNSEGTASSGMNGPLLAIWKYTAASLLPVRSLLAAAKAKPAAMEVPGG